MVSEADQITGLLESLLLSRCELRYVHEEPEKHEHECGGDAYPSLGSDALVEETQAA